MDCREKYQVKVSVGLAIVIVDAYILVTQGQWLEIYDQSATGERMIEPKQSKIFLLIWIFRKSCVVLLSTH